MPTLGLSISLPPLLPPSLSLSLSVLSVSVCLSLSVSLCLCLCLSFCLSVCLCVYLPPPPPPPRHPYTVTEAFNPMRLVTLWQKKNQASSPTRRLSIPFPVFCNRWAITIIHYRLGRLRHWNARYVCPTRLFLRQRFSSWLPGDRGRRNSGSSATPLKRKKKKRSLE